jgi:signal transduction histidine kinase
MVTLNRPRGPLPCPPRGEPLTKTQETIVSYVFAVGSCLIAFLLTVKFSPHMKSPLFELFQLAVVLSAFRGMGPGIVSATISFLIIDYYFVPPIRGFALGSHLWRLVIYEAVAIVTSLVTSRLRSTTRELAAMHADLEDRIRRRTEELEQANEALRREVENRLEAERAILDISAREQRRLGQDLHDGLAQTLAGTRLIIENLAEKSREGVVEADALSSIDARLSEALMQANDVSRGLYPVELENNGLMAALEEMAVAVSKRYGIDCRFRTWDRIDFKDTAAATHLYRIAQEAVVNAIKGGKARRVNVRLAASGPSIVLRVTDNGIGLKNAPPRNGMGLKIMQYRARMIDAKLRFRSGPRGGTTVSCSVSAPVER